MTGDSNWPIPPNGELWPDNHKPFKADLIEKPTVASVAASIVAYQPQLNLGHVIEIAEDLIQRLRKGGHL